MSFQVSRSRAEGFEFIELSHAGSGISARIAPEFGWNLYHLRLPVAGKPTPVLLEPPSPADMKATPSRYGHPILFPFPNRIRGGQYSFNGKAYETPVNNGGNAIHGFVLRSAWTVTETSADADSAQATARWQLSKNAPEHSAHWPADAVLDVTYELSTTGLRIIAEVSNPGQHPLPWGLGYHTYFRLPLSDQTGTDQMRIIIPASRRWHLEQFLPDGTKEALPKSLDFRHGLPLKGLKADDVLTDLAHGADGQTTCQLQDLATGWEVVVTTSRLFSELVVFTPPWSANSIAIEPYTQTTDAINLAAKGIDGGLKTLQPGESVRLEMAIHCRKISS